MIYELPLNAVRVGEAESAQEPDPQRHAIAYKTPA
jgi:hypothetical protein